MASYDNDKMNVLMIGDLTLFSKVRNLQLYSESRSIISDSTIGIYVVWYTIINNKMNIFMVGDWTLFSKVRNPQLYNELRSIISDSTIRIYGVGNRVFICAEPNPPGRPIAGLVWKTRRNIAVRYLSLQY